jgi:hypothetical protein
VSERCPATDFDRHPRPPPTHPLVASETCIRNSSELAGQGSLFWPRLSQSWRLRGLDTRSSTADWLGCGLGGLAGWLADTPLRSLAADGFPRPFFRCLPRVAGPKDRQCLDRQIDLSASTEIGFGFLVERCSSSFVRPSQRLLDFETGSAATQLRCRLFRGKFDLPHARAEQAREGHWLTRTTTRTTTASQHPEQAILDPYKPSAKQLIRQVDMSTLITHATLSETQKLSVSGPLLPPLPHGRHHQPRTRGITDHGMRAGWVNQTTALHVD